MKGRMIIYISILVFLTAIIYSNILEIQSKEYIEAGIKSQSEDVAAVALFKYLPSDW